MDNKQSFNKKDVQIRFAMRKDFKEMIEKSNIYKSLKLTYTVMVKNVL